MILLIGPQQDPMIEAVWEELQSRGLRFRRIDVHDLPATVRFGFIEPGGTGYVRFPDDELLPVEAVTSVFHRVGFANFEVFEDYTDQEVEYVNAQCQAALFAYLNFSRALVVNRPVASGSNASKPFQIEKIREHGFRVPDTLVTTLPQSAAEFYQRHEGRVIYKSVSYVRSIVTGMTQDDLERLDTVRNCPVQLQERVEGTDIRVHVVGDGAAFASIITAQESDYRYDRQSRIEPGEIPPEIRDRCFALTRALGLSVAGIDLRRTGEGEFYCFEVNPSPAFSWYEARTGQPIASAVVDLLAG
ncbi:MAG: hypothetical protein HY319_10905 [Armatimonadetes bacterium]|nr:hypothetical protein [Armatimonadota bacterium]